MKHVNAVLMAVLLSAATAASAQENEPFVRWAHFCNWLSKDSWTKTGTIPFRSSGRGIGYSSSDPGIIAQQNEEMLKYGITPWVSNWGEYHYAGDVYLDKYLKVASPLKIGILLEVTGLLKSVAPGNPYIDFNDSENRKRFGDALERLHRKYFTHPQYASRFHRINGKPVVFDWFTHASLGDFGRAIREARTRADFHLVCSDFNISGTARPETASYVKECDSLSAYGIYEQPATVLSGGWLDERYVEQIKHGVRWWMDWLKKNAPKTKLILPIQFAYNDTLVRPEAGNPILMSTKEQAQALANALKPFLRCAATGARGFETLDGKAINIDSYSEHFEGSAVEPGTTVGASPPYGYDYIDILHDTFSDLPVGQSFTDDVRERNPGTCESLLLGRR